MGKSITRSPLAKLVEAAFQGGSISLNVLKLLNSNHALEIGKQTPS